MQEKNQIDKLFSDKLGAIRPTAPDAVWEAISDSLRGQRKKRSFFIWQRAAAIFIAMLTLSGAIGYYYLSVNDMSADEIITSTSVSNESIHHGQSQTYAEINATASSEADSLINDITLPNKNNEFVLQENSGARGVVIGDELSVSTISNRNSIADNHDASGIDQRPSKTESLETLHPIVYHSLARESEYPLEQVIAQANQPDVETVNQRIFEAISQQQNSSASTPQGISLSGQLGPQYTGSSIDEFNSGEEPIEQGLMAYAGGVNINVPASRRLSVQTGVYYNRMGSTANYYSPTFIGSDNKSIRSDNTVYTFGGARDSWGGDGEGPNENTGDVYVRAPGAYYAANGITQDVVNYKLQSEYIEVPLYLRYTVLEYKFNVHVLGGVSANFLVNERLTQEGGTMLHNVGDYERPNSINYNSTVGLGVVYPVYDCLQLSFEPVFKYFLRSQSSLTADHTNPYSMGVMAGVTYIFR